MTRSASTASRDAAATVLTPQAKIERGIRLQAEGQRLIIEGTIEERGASAEWVDQRSSPLGRRKHLALAREGKLPSQKHGSRVLVRRDDLNAYIEREGLGRGRRVDDEDVTDVVEGILKTGARR